MKKLFWSVFALASLASNISCAPTQSSQKLPLPSKTLYQFPQTPTWIENLAVRSNGHLLFGVIGDGNLYTLNPASKTSPTVVHSFEQTNNLNALLGIAEISPDVFAVVVGNSTGFSHVIPGSFSVWKVDVHHAQAQVSKIGDIAKAQFPNGMVALPGDDNCGTLLIADSALGAVWALDVESGQSQISIQAPDMAPPPNAPAPLGINGMKTFGDYLYFTNSLRGTLYRIKIDHQGHAALGSSVEVVASTGMLLDDFSFDTQGNTWIAANGNNTILVVDANNYNVVPVVGGNTQQTVEGCTATHFGRAPWDWQTLYVTTSGGVLLPINGTVSEAGKIVAIDTREFVST